MSGPLANPAFRRLWVAGFVSEIGDWVLQVAMPIYVYQLTGSVGATATTFVVALLPGIALSPVAGVLADRWDRRRLMLLVSVAQALALLPLLAVRGAEDLVLVNVVTACQAGLAALFEPAKSALLPSLLERDQITAANGLIGLNGNLARLLGASLGGVLLGCTGLPGVLAADAASFLLAAALLVRAFGVDAEPVEHPPVVRAWVEGLREITGRRQLRFMVLVVGLMSTAQGLFVVLFVVFVTERIGGDEAATGLLRGVQAVGGLVGGALVGVLARRFVPGRVLAWGLLSLGVLSAVIWNSASLTTSLPYYLVGFAVVGAPGVVVGAGMLSVLQLHTSDATRGRVLSSFFSLFDGFQAVGMIIAGALVGPFGLPVLLDVQAGLYVLAGVLAVQRQWGDGDEQRGRDEEGHDRVEVVQGHDQRR
ncbi:putative MFS family arabinose efflux permease [Umezawaea tangerina]|uniref:Putative MFS family arabinose efflux permease n=1 Tax=Umezawaea tangerina TaxID=84725 RepID=A0A2T0SXM9_9PSEU|nr:putative MFS family arabinose efflux permease [Umezawaea tangerina]